MLKVFTIFDDKAQYFNTPFFTTNQNIAIRDFSDIINSSGTVAGRHPEDFRLYSLGDFDDETGKFTQLDIPLLICTGTQLIKPEPSLDQPLRTESQD